MPARTHSLRSPAAGADDHLDEALLLAFTREELEPEGRGQVLEHLSSCQRCRAVLLALGEESTVQNEPRTETLAPPGSAEPDPLVGQTIGEYQVLEKLAQGGMGAVYRGLQPVIGKPVAIKVLLPEVAASADHAHRLLAEARAANAIRHPHIVDIFSFGTLPDARHYLVMELLAGSSLSRWVRSRQRLEPRAAVDILAQVMGALAAAHAAGVTHRDLKPSNLFVTELTERLHVTVLDFGLAKRHELGGGKALTLPGVVLGTPGFMAPEQIMGKTVGPPADLYAMGAVTHLMLTGAEVFSAPSELELLRAHLQLVPPTIASRGASVPGVFEELITSMLAKDPGARPTADQVRRHCERLQEQLRPRPTISVRWDELRTEPVTSAPPQKVSRTRPAPPPRGSSKSKVWLVGLIGVLAGALLVLAASRALQFEAAAEDREQVSARIAALSARAAQLGDDALAQRCMRELDAQRAALASGTSAAMVDAVLSRLEADCRLQPPAR